jgi:hypothetical protein
MAVTIATRIKSGDVRCFAGMKPIRLAESPMMNQPQCYTGSTMGARREM